MSPSSFHTKALPTAWTSPLVFKLFLLLIVPGKILYVLRCSATLDLVLPSTASTWQLSNVPLHVGTVTSLVWFLATISICWTQARHSQPADLPASLCGNVLQSHMSLNVRVCVCVCVCACVCVVSREQDQSGDQELRILTQHGCPPSPNPYSYHHIPERPV